MDGVWTRRWKRAQNLIIALGFQVAMPAFPFLAAALKNDGKVPDAVWATGASFYVLGLASGCKNKSAFSLSMLCGLALAVCFGVDPAKAEKLTSSGNWFVTMCMVVVGGAFLADRLYYHYLKGEGFGPFDGEG